MSRIVDSLVRAGVDEEVAAVIERRYTAQVPVTLYLLLLAKKIEDAADDFGAIRDERRTA